MMRSLSEPPLSTSPLPQQQATMYTHATNLPTFSPHSRASSTSSSTSLPPSPASSARSTASITAIPPPLLHALSNSIKDHVSLQLKFMRASSDDADEFDDDADFDGDADERSAFAPPPPPPPRPPSSSPTSLHLRSAATSLSVHSAESDARCLIDGDFFALIKEFGRNVKCAQRNKHMTARARSVSESDRDDDDDFGSDEDAADDSFNARFVRNSGVDGCGYDYRYRFGYDTYSGLTDSEDSERLTDDELDSPRGRKRRAHIDTAATAAADPSLNDTDVGSSSGSGSDQSPQQRTDSVCASPQPSTHSAGTNDKRTTIAAPRTRSQQT